MDMMSYLMGRNSGGAKKGVKIEVVTELPETGEANVIYLVPKQDEDENNIFDEYLYINDEWELIGSTAIDLSDYYTKSETQQLINASVYKGQEIVTIEQYVGSGNIDFSNDNIAKVNSILNKSNVKTEEYVKFIISMTPDAQNTGSVAQTNDFLIFVNIKKSSSNQSYNASCIALKLDKYNTKLLYTGVAIYYTTGSDGLPSNITGIRIKNESSKELATKDYVDDSIAAAITTTLGGSY